MDIGYWILRILPLFRGDSNTQVPNINYPAAKDLAEFVKFPMAKMNHAEKSEWVNRMGEITTKWFLSTIHTTHAKDYHTSNHF